MRVDGEHYRTIWTDPDDAGAVWVIDQQALPFEFRTLAIVDSSAMAATIADMTVRGAGLIGAAAGYGMALAAAEAGDDEDPAPRLAAAASELMASRPTAVNLEWAVQRVLGAVRDLRGEALVSAARREAQAIADQDVESCASIGAHGVDLVAEVHRRTGETVHVLTHCNAGWLAFVDHGTATAPIYAAHDQGIPVHVWVDETRPRNQGARLTAWELGGHGVPHTVIADNAGGHLMQRGMVDLVITGSDRTTRCGDVANKIGTYLKALAASDNNIPFYAALPSSTIDWQLRDGIAGTPIEERDPDEVTHVEGMSPSGPTSVRVVPETSAAANFGFDVTPARLVSGIITERGICEASEDAIVALYPEHAEPQEATDD